nr:MAG TPA: hypothetical protein [Bacteriophage sp.]
MLITMSITVEEAGEVEARRVAAALAAALAPAKPAEAKPEPKAAKPEAPKAEAKPEPKAAKPEAPKAEVAGDGPTEEELLDQAALHAVALMQAGMTGSVREALTAVGARRVSQIQGVDALQKFISLLPEVPASEDA